MKIDADKVYLYRVEIDRAEAPFEAYRDLAYRALSKVDLNLPAEGAVFLKPNATVLFPAEKRIVTHPGFLAGMLDALMEKGVGRERLAVGDGQSGEQPDRGNTWEGAGYRGMLAGRGARLAALNETATRTVEAPGGVVFKEYPVYREVTDCAFLFNAPLAKCHNLGCTTLSVKNLMGILGRPERHLCRIQEVDQPFEEGIWRLTESGLSLFEDRFYHKLCDVVAALRGLKVPRLCVVDGLIGRDGTAFNEGENYPLGWALIGENEVHVDTVGTYLMGLDPLATPYLKFAAGRGLGTNRVEEIEVVDLASGARLGEAGLKALRSRRTLMPIARYEGGYYDRFRADGSVVPWRIDDVNAQRRKDGLEAVPVK
ncbi:MAG: hypothetical protein A3F84_23360 [Candidatus Handelsmanbacteria bacterium RIFCSPLOWO2_12_FULL_64_10]|uniref:DUF362 domain-containing protein n=1 Tax=Handelsmanbacteria sp. (strain RIFCSPLOWO2_12_FULL_64_10) TaxID=1817868 RepID=A0A1F6CTA3_HANXR|nr:MAG: hypothetical protein A3F84_23360 [Candidatus Handelsmanbacteria bacterium RIFCSPLOWO2_12_FULL_64_10]